MIGRHHRAAAMAVMLVVMLLALGSITVSHAEIVSGTTSATTSGFTFLGKFCFDFFPCPSCTQQQKDDSAPGQYVIDLSVAGTPSDTSTLLLYDDDDSSWPLVFDNPGDTCVGKRSHARNAKPDGSVETPYQVKYAAGKWSLTAHITQGLRPRYWFLAVSDCGKALPEITYNIHFKNIRASSWDAELGVNIQGLNTVYLIYFFIFTVFLGVHLFGVRRLSQKLNFLHPLVRLFLLILVLEYLSVLLNMIHMSSFAGNGKGLPALDRCASIFEIMARVFFLLLLMLLAKGWTISGEGLSGKKVIIITAVSFAVVYVIILIWKFLAEDPAETHTSTGLVVLQVLLMVVWLFFAFWFIYTIYGSYKKEDNPVKKTLYGRLAMLYSPWFLALPFVVFLSFALNPWVREKTIITLQLTFTFLAYTVMGFLQWPSRAEEYFDIATPEVSKGAIESYEQL